MLSRKKILSVLFMIVLTLSFFSNNVWGENWIEYSSHNDGTIFNYDKDSVRNSSGIVKVWNDVIFGDVYKHEVITDLKKQNKCKNCEYLSYTRSLIEIKCKEDLSRIITSVYYDTDGRVLDTFVPSEWNNIIPDSIMEGLKNIICN